MSEAIHLNLQYPDLPMNNDIVGNKIAVDNTALFEEVFKAHFKNLHIYAYTIVRDEAAAEELVQNVFVRLWEQKERLSATLSVTAYLYKSVYNESLNFLKHNRVKDNYKAHAANHHRVFDDTMDPAALKELQQKIDAALNDLPEQCRTIFQLSRFEELTYRAIAEKLGISVKTVENQMGKALRILRTKLVAYLPVLLLLIELKKMLR